MLIKDLIDSRKKKKQRAKNKQRGRSSSPLTIQKAKKQNTAQTVEIPPTQQTTETPEPVVFMEVDPPSSKKAKKKKLWKRLQQ
ncbi:10112_t:CDS:2 [Funneliformis geosporum]|nr:10112_t:CDS:2 [Funneliformis geosporum]